MATPDQSEQSSERQFLENLLNTRVNFLVAVFALACAAAATLNSPLAQIAVLGGSTLITSMLALATSRAQFKLDIILTALESSHPAKTTDEEAKAKAAALSGIPRAVVGGSRRRIVGYWLPWTTTLFLLVATVGSLVAWNSSSRQDASALADASRRIEDRVAALADSVSLLRRDVSSSTAIARIMLDSIRAAVRSSAHTSTK